MDLGFAGPLDANSLKLSVGLHAEACVKHSGRVHTPLPCIGTRQGVAFSLVNQSNGTALRVFQEVWDFPLPTGIDVRVLS